MYPKYKSPVKYFKDFHLLSLTELKRVKKSHEELLAKYESYKNEISGNEKINSENQFQYERETKINQEWYSTNLQPLLDDEKKKLALLKNFEVSLFSIANFGSNTVNYENTKYKKDASSLIDELIEIKSKIKQKQKDRPQASYPVKVINPKPVSSTKLFKFKGVGCNINFRQIEASVWDELIKIRLEEIEEKKKEVLRLKAIAAANNFETRKIASTHRKKYPLEKQLTYFQDCPYCDAELNNINAVLEHIIPVALGGRSTEKNLVWICNKCNSQKSDLTLTQYCKKNKLNREKIEGNLEWLQKIF